MDEKYVHLYQLKFYIRMPPWMSRVIGVFCTVCSSDGTHCCIGEKSGEQCGELSCEGTAHKENVVGQNGRLISCTYIHTYNYYVGYRRRVLGSDDVAAAVLSSGKIRNCSSDRRRRQQYKRRRPFPILLVVPVTVTLTRPPA